jgi:hypothetical protein
MRNVDISKLPETLDAALWEYLEYGTADQWNAFSQEEKDRLNMMHRRAVRGKKDVRPDPLIHTTWQFVKE